MTTFKAVLRGGNIALLMAALCGCSRDEARKKESSSTGDPVNTKKDNSGLYLAPASASEARATAVLPAKGSEDVSHLLGKIELTPLAKVAPGKEEYLPSENVDWVLTAKFDGDPRLDPKTVSGLFDEVWRKKHGSFSSYGRAADNGCWTFLLSVDGPAAITELKLAWDYVDPLNPDVAIPIESVFKQRMDEVGNKLNSLSKCKISATLTPVAAVTRAKALKELKATCNVSAILILKAPTGQRFDGLLIWDVMLCLGLKWGDMDCFHWENPSREGDDFFFSVETSTPPGYFLPEQIAAGRVKVDDLVFVFSVPRSCEPTKVFDSMSKAIEYCQRRLKGNITDENGRPADLTKIKDRISNIERRLREAGFEPGRNGTLRLF